MNTESQHDEFLYNEVEPDEAAIRRSARRKKEHSQRVFFIVLILIAAAAICAAVYALVLVPADSDLPWPSFLGSRPSSTKKGSSNILSTENTLIEVISSQFSGQSEEAGDTAGVSPVTEAAAETESEALTESETETSPVLLPSQTDEGQAGISKAAYLAAGYDYDGAITALTGISGYEGDASILQLIDDYTAARDSCVAVDPYTVPHIFYHSLLNSTARAFDVETLGQAAVDGYNAWMVTVDEFDQITQRLYDAGYVYVRLRDLVVETVDSDGTVHFTPNTSLMLPEGKKAIVLSVDDCSYYHSYAAASFPDKLVLDDNGDVKCLYTDAAGNTSVGDYDVVPRLNSFLAEHPDGAYHGARGIMAMTGYNGVFGYRTDSDYLLREHLMDDQRQWLDSHPDFDYDQEVADATAIADALKEEGWEFASHTWGHLSVTDKTVDDLKADNEKWVATVEPIVGPVDTIIFAHGNDIGSWEGYTEDNEKYEYYNSAGYHFYCNVDGSVPYWVQITDSYVRQGRIDVDGYRLYEAQLGEDNSLSQLIDLTGIFDENRPTPVIANGQS